MADPGTIAAIIAATTAIGGTAYSMSQRPEKPSTPALPSAPEEKASEVKTQALEEQKRRLRRASLVGRRSTILTSGEDLGIAPVVRKTLLGE